MSRPDDGGPAFPRPLSTDDHQNQCNLYDEQDGMTLWEYTAIAAMQGLLATVPPGARRDLAVEAGLYADEMMAERRRRRGETNNDE